MEKEIRSIRKYLVFFMIALFISGLTAMPAEKELEILTQWISADSLLGSWLQKVYTGVANTNRQYPFIAYGYDWLAFAHFILAILFIGPYKDPVRNKWIIEFGMIACVMILPFAFITGSFRGIPISWRLIDCSFGIIGLVPLTACYKKINQLENLLIQSTAL